MFSTSLLSALHHSCPAACLQPGEELTFDYMCVTDSEKEFKSAVCLCGTAHCRGSYLLQEGSKAFSVVSRMGRIVA